MRMKIVGLLLVLAIFLLVHPTEQTEKDGKKNHQKNADEKGTEEKLVKEKSGDGEVGGEAEKPNGKKNGEGEESPKNEEEKDVSKRGKADEKEKAVEHTSERAGGSKCKHEAETDDAQGEFESDKAKKEMDDKLETEEAGHKRVNSSLKSAAENKNGVEEVKNEENAGTDQAKEENFEKVIAEDIKAVEEHFEKIKDRLSQEKAARSGKIRGPHRGAVPEQGDGQKEGTPNRIQAVANSIYKLHLKCPDGYSKQHNGPFTEEEQHWFMNCTILADVKKALGEWLEFIKDYEISEPNKNEDKNLVKKKSNKQSGKEEDEEKVGKMTAIMSVRPDLMEGVAPLPPNEHPQTDGGKAGDAPQWMPEMGGDPVEMTKLLNIFEELAKNNGAEQPIEFKIEGRLAWNNEAAYRFVKKLKEDYEGAEGHEDGSKEDEDRIELDDIWNKEKDVLSGNSTKFTVEKHRNKYDEHVKVHTQHLLNHLFADTGNNVVKKRKRGLGPVANIEGHGSIKTPEHPNGFKHEGEQHKKESSLNEKKDAGLEHHGNSKKGAKK